MRLSAAVIILLVLATPPAEAARVILVGDSIPAYYAIEAAILFDGSDTLLLNNRVLSRGADYRFDRSRRAFDLSALDPGPTDTLVLIYRAAPSWLAAAYGNPLPELLPPSGATPTATLPSRRRQTVTPSSGLSLSGAKAFRFDARSAGASDFSQSLDLTVSGELTPGLTIRGAISDRGYDPAYGTANSRLNELNKVNLEMESRRFLARIGDIEFQLRYAALQPHTKRVSGVWATVRDPRWYVEASAARPKGLFESVVLSGEDGVQGPYQIGGRAQPIVPGSETVWLDGRRLERGVNNDYVMDYPAGTITFSVGRPIDRRRRIEIDYEPQATDYRGELFSGGAGVSLGDSAFTFETGWFREGDDRNEPLIGDLSESDRALLENAGDSADLTYRSGVRADTTGDYALVADSLPDSVYQYVGAGGAYAITFSYVGALKGDYRNLGANRFEYVGAGAGEYLPVVLLAAPERTDQYLARGQWRDPDVGQFSFEYRHSELDRNLFSELDDADNAGNLVSLGYSRAWGRVERGDGARLRSRYREATFRTRDRVNEPEFNRTYHLPVEYLPVSDEWLHEGNVTVSPVAAITVTPGAALLRYDDGTEAARAGVGASLRPSQRIEVTGSLWSTRTDLNASGGAADGEAIAADGRMQYRPDEKWQFAAGGDFDRRTNSYTGPVRGTRYWRGYAEAGQKTERLRLERYEEDSLHGAWDDALSRTRVELHSGRRLGNFSYTSVTTWQWLELPLSDESSFLERLSVQYSDVKSRLTATASYQLSDETRNVRGITYLEVEQGRGDYIFEDSQFVPDANGNFIRVEEVLSDRSPVSRGEKSFYIGKDWRVASVRFTSRTEEELLDEGRRTALWALPFYADPDEAYQFFTSRYTGELRLFPIRNAHAVNIEGSHDREIRRIGGNNRDRRDRKGTVTFKQAVGQTHLEESVGAFDSNRDSYYSGAGEIDGWRGDVAVKQIIGAHEISAGGGYREASARTGEESRQFLLRGGLRLAVKQKGEMRTAVELYRQDFADVVGLPTYTLTDNRPGERGAIWSVELRYGVRKDFRVNFSIDGRHSDDRTARITARGEMVAGF